MFKRKRSTKRNKLKWLIAGIALLVIGITVFYVKFASATFSGNNGDIAWGDTGTGRIRLDLSTYSVTNASPYSAFGTSFRPTVAPDASAIQFVVNKAAPTRNEKLTGYQLNDGQLYIAKCLGVCSATGNLTAAVWHTAIYGSGIVKRGFDIAYEQKSGRAMVVYTGNTTGKLYYCIWDGSSWGPVSTCAPTNGTNDIALTNGTTTLSTPEWVRLVSNGSQYGTNRTNDILLAVQDNGQKQFVIHWNGSSWLTTDRAIVTQSGGNSVATSDNGAVFVQSYDVGWESLTGTEFVVYANGSTLSYATSTGSGWSGGSTIQTLGNSPTWIRLASDPLSNRMSLITAFSTTARDYIWKTDGTTAGWTAGTDLAMGTAAYNINQDIDTAWLKCNGSSGTCTPKAVFTSGTNTNGTRPDWSSWTQSGGFVAWAIVAACNGTCSNQIDSELTPSPNSDVLNLMQADVNGRLRAIYYNGSSWGTVIITNLTTALINTATTKTNGKTNTQKPYQFAFTPYSAWSLNWRVYDDEGATGNPGTALAAEDTIPTVQPSNTVRLRMNYAELSGGVENDVRKKLQYSSGAGCPDSTSCTWTDVGAQASGSIWRYANGGATDNSSVPSTLLDGSTANGYFVENGTTNSGDSQTAGSVQEYDYTIQNNGATVGTNYYFRGYDYGPSASGGSATNLGPILREQTLDINGVENTSCTDGTTNQVCTYPTLFAYSTDPNPPTFYSPLNGSSNSSATPTIQLKSIDVLGNPLQYVIEWCPSNSWPCPSGGGSFDQVATAGSGEPDWTSQDATVGGNGAYVAQPNEANSTMANYSVSSGIFSPNTTYYLRAKAYDPGGSLTYGTYSSTIGFTTSSLNILIQGGTCIGGVGASCTSGSGATIPKVCIGGVVGVTCN